MICEPLELEYLAASLDGHEFRIVDLILERGRKLKDALSSFSPDVVATTCYINGVNEAIKVCRLAKQANRNVFTTVGGVHAAVAPEDLSDPSIDCIALGEGSTLMPIILGAAAGKRELQSIPNIAIPSGPRMVRRTASAAYIQDPDRLPFPRRDLTAHLRHKYYYLFHRPVATMKTTWGCWYTCDFCMTWGITRGIPFSRSPESIVEEISRIVEKELYIVDDIFLINESRLNDIAAMIRSRGIQKNYLAYGRADFIAKNEEVIREWSELGLTAVIVGLEGTTDSELRDLDKRCTLEQNRKAIDVLRKNHIDLYASLIPRPDYEPKDWNRLARFIEEEKIYYVNISPLTPLPGSPLWSRYEKQISVDRAAHGLWDLTHCVLPTVMPLLKYYRQLLKLYARTVLNIRRAGRTTLRTRPPVWSGKYLRLWLGAARIFLQFISAHRHHSERQFSIARDRGPEPEDMSYCWQRQQQRKGYSPGNNRHGSEISTDSSKSNKYGPVSPFEGFISSRGELRHDANNGLLDLHAARRWFEIFSWSMTDDLYVYQQPFSSNSAPICQLNGTAYRMLSSYDYLGLIGHPEIKAAAVAAIDRYGAGTGGVRLLTGTTELHNELEQSLAAFKGVEAAIGFSSGYVANLACITALLGPRDLVVLDARIHRSIKDACRMARVPVRIFPHNDCDALEAILRTRPPVQRTLVVIEGAYSMNGDLPPFLDIVELKNRYGAYLMVDEAHSIGVLGRNGHGINEHFGLPADSADIWMGTFSKALGATGGYIAGNRPLITYLQHGASPSMFSAAASPPTVAAALTALNILRREPERVAVVARNAAFIRNRLSEAGFDIGGSQSHIIPVILGGEETAWRFSRQLFGIGIIALAVVWPAVGKGKARLRLCATASQEDSFLQSAMQDITAAHAAFVKSECTAL